MIGGFNDRNPLELKANLLKWIRSIINTNLIICGLPSNAKMFAFNLNYDVKMICQGFSYSLFVEMNYKNSRQGSKYFLPNLCFSIYREILHSAYTHKNSLDVNLSSETINQRKNLNSLTLQDGVSNLQCQNKLVQKSVDNSFL